MIICHDVAELYDTDMGDNLIAGALDPDFAGQCNMKNSEMRQYCKIHWDWIIRLYIFRREYLCLMLQK